jgi:hypothetical protein
VADVPDVDDLTQQIDRPVADVAGVDDLTQSIDRPVADVPQIDDLTQQIDRPVADVPQIDPQTLNPSDVIVGQLPVELLPRLAPLPDVPPIDVTLIPQLADTPLESRREAAASQRQATPAASRDSGTRDTVTVLRQIARQNTDNAIDFRNMRTALDDILTEMLSAEDV